ncbi:MAG: SDR family oxidoreductase [Candidatus Aminicenantes bacterium]|nr:MAG: SDR family oxidoreductase [Candidatus Aminicenantes bacterium]
MTSGKKEGNKISIEGRKLKGRVAIVTGGSRGIGRGIAFRLAEEGARVLVADIDSLNAKKAAEALTEKHLEAVPVQVDITKERSVDEMVKIALKAFKKIDILINNAGIMFRTRLQDLSLKEWEDIIKVNLTGPFLCSKAVIPFMKRNGYGRVVNISSSAGRSVSTLGGAHYTASKAGLLGLTRAVAKETAPFGITVNAVCPGLIDTQMARDTTTKAELNAFIDSFPIKRLGLPEEIGDLVVFLCSQKATYITGASIDINGGDLMI